LQIANKDRRFAFQPYTDRSRKDVPQYAGIARQDGGDVRQKQGAANALFAVEQNRSLFLSSFSDDPSSGLAEILRFGLLRRLLRTGLCSLFYLIGLALCFIGFCTLFRHTHSFPQAGFWRYPCGFQTAPLPARFISRPFVAAQHNSFVPDCSDLKCHGYFPPALDEEPF
jgi:hypothetical protein